MEDERSIAIFLVTALVVVSSILGKCDWPWGLGAGGAFLMWNFGIDPWLTQRKKRKGR